MEVGHIIGIAQSHRLKIQTPLAFLMEFEASYHICAIVLYAIYSHISIGWQLQTAGEENLIASFSCSVGHFTNSIYMLLSAVIFNRFMGRLL